MNRVYLLFFSPGPAWDESNDVFGQALDGHLDYLASGHGDAKVLLAGPFADGSGGVTLVQAPDRSTASEMAHADPAVQAGILRVRVAQWMPIALEGNGYHTGPYEISTGSELGSRSEVREAPED